MPSDDEIVELVWRPSTLRSDDPSVAVALAIERELSTLDPQAQMSLLANIYHRVRERAWQDFAGGN